MQRARQSIYREKPRVSQYTQQQQQRKGKKATSTSSLATLDALSPSDYPLQLHRPDSPPSRRKGPSGDARVNHALLPPHFNIQSSSFPEFGPWKIGRMAGGEVQGQHVLPSFLPFPSCPPRANPPPLPQLHSSQDSQKSRLARRTQSVEDGGEVGLSQGQTAAAAAAAAAGRPVWPPG